MHQGVFCLQAKELAEAQERMRWHEMMSRRNIDNSEALQARPAPVHLSSAPACASLSSSTEHICIKHLQAWSIAESCSAWLCKHTVSEVAYAMAPKSVFFL